VAGGVARTLLLAVVLEPRALRWVEPRTPLTDGVGRTVWSAGTTGETTSGARAGATAVGLICSVPIIGSDGCSAGGAGAGSAEGEAAGTDSGTATGSGCATWAGESTGCSGAGGAGEARGGRNVSGST
jgi:hypothetical protein